MTSFLLGIYYWFRMLEGLVSLAMGGERRRLAYRLDASIHHGLDSLERGWHGSSLLVFASTIGEFHAVKPVIEAYRRRWPKDRLVLFTSYTQYIGMIAATYPDAMVGLPSLRAPWLLKRFFRLTRPRVFLISEGPVLHGYFPQSLGIALPATCLAHRIPVIVTNATPHKSSLASGIDAIEHRLFSSLYRDSISRWFPPYNEFRQELIAAGAPANKIIYFGELRFDSLHAAAAPTQPGLIRLLRLYKESEYPLFVAGSVNGNDESELVIAAWVQARRRLANLRLVIAPRYVNNPEVIGNIREILHRNKADFLLRSDSASNDRLADVLLVDVFGELGHFYSIASVSFIGRNHGILEPMAYNCPTVVGVGWLPDFPAIKLYDYMVRERGVICASDQGDLTHAIIQLHEDSGFRERLLIQAQKLIASNRGTSERIIAELERVLDD